MKLKELKLYPVKGSSQLRAKANVTFVNDSGWEITIKGFRVHDDGKKAPWVGVPTERYSKNGRDEYIETLWINQQVQAELYPKVIEHYKKGIKNNF